MDSIQYPWYAVINENSLEQGDFLNNFPIVIPPLSLFSEVTDKAKDDEILDLEEELDILKFNVVVMTQSCDLNDLQDNDHIILCPRYDFEQYIEARNLNQSDRWGKLVRGQIVGNHLLNRFESKDISFEYQVVDLINILTVPYGFAKEVAKAQTRRVRLSPPYREHLAQAFSRQFMRVGLPIDLPRKYPG